MATISVNQIMLVTVLLLLFVGSISGFNLDTQNCVTHVSDQPGSMFGFAVAQHKDRGRSVLLVGAPKYDTDQRLRGVEQAGAVLQCSPDMAGVCEYVPFDRNGNNVHPLGERLDSKSKQWFGATVRSSGQDGVVVACAPRYVWYTEKLVRREPVGTCYVARNGLTDFQEYSPCRTRDWGYHRQGSCQAGFDAVITSDAKRMYIGAPGAFYWQGQIHSQMLRNGTQYYKTWEGPATDDDQYLGYSVAVGDFTGDGEQDVALGVPKGLNYAGKIALYSYDLVPLQNITGYQLGSYFGYCLAVVDFNADGLDDIIVGSPMYTDYDDREMKFEVGRVHVILQNQVHRFKQVVTFNGEVNRGRFGLSLTGLGDINMDGIADLAVGAPYGGENGNGAVFIYHGFKITSGELISEDKRKPTQVIYAEEVSRTYGQPISTFGWSLSGGQDMDNNLYPDLLVGAYLTDTAVLLKSRPIVTLLNHSLVFMSEGKTIDIDIEENATTCQNFMGRPVPCINLKFCIGYAGVGVPTDVELNVVYGLDIKVNEPRLFFAANNHWNMTEILALEKEIETCKIHEVYVRPSLTDKLTPMSADVQIELVEPQYRRTPRSLTPILNQQQKLSLSDSITIQKNCGPDNVCIPDLMLSFEAPDIIIYGKNEQLEVAVRVGNNAEDAFEAMVYIPVPVGLLYNKFIAKDNTTVTCSPLTTGSRETVVCDIGNPLPMHKGVYFIVLFQLTDTKNEARFDFLVTANSTNSEESRNQEDNVALHTVLVEVDTELLLYGASVPENIEYNRTLYDFENKNHEELLGPEITHRYGLSNRGPSDILAAEVIILWPTKSLNGNYLLYLLEQPTTTGAVNCSVVPDVNPLGLLLVEKEVNLELSSKDVSEVITVEEGLAEVSSEDISGGATGGGSSQSSSSETTHFSSSSSSGGNSSHSYSSSSSSSTSYSSSSSSSSKSYSYSSSSSSDSSSAGENEIVRRRTRQVDSSPDWESEISNCGPTICTKIHCTVGPMAEKDIFYIYIRSRLVVDTLLYYPYDDVSITSKMVARATTLPHGVNPEILSVRTLDVTTPVSPAKSLDEAPPIPWWVIVLATMAGVLILLIIILILWKCGYFKRHRPQHQARIAEDTQPLSPPNSHNGHNGHNPYSRPFYPGDEAL